MEQTTQHSFAEMENQKIFCTQDYEIFKPFFGNRTINRRHCLKLKKSIKENYLMSVLIVNEQFEIIDGQHRFDVLKELNLPIYYTVCEGYGLAEIHILNQNSKTWEYTDFLDAFCDLGYEEYIKLKEFRKRFGFGHKETLALLYDIHDSFSKLSEIFQSGEFKIDDWDEGYRKAEIIESFKGLYEGYNRRVFLFTFLRLLKNKDFDVEVFREKLNMQPRSLTHCINMKQYLLQIEEIYNYKSRDKISLRY